MNPYDQARLVESRAWKVLQPFIEIQSNGRYVLTEKGRLSTFMQRYVGDVILNKLGEMHSLELKAENRWTGNLFLETWSNRNLNDPKSYAMYGSNLGWLYHTRADYLFYIFLDCEILYIIDMLALKRWAFGYGDIPGRIYGYPERTQSKYAQMNETLGRCVPIDILKQQLVISMQEHHLGDDQGTLL